MNGRKGRRWSAGTWRGRAAAAGLTFHHHDQGEWVWGHAHCLGDLVDDASMQLAERLVQRPVEAAHKAGTMRMLADPIGFTVHAATFRT